tara:strand:+ start:1532 stop:7843 length:6312 start_codon:yes stop_codon:yes gene_type:complete
MANVTTDFNVTPYYDDFDEDKRFLRVLFRPGFAVQGRELTQLQTILQKQISRFGDHIFKDGSKVLGGEVTLDTEVKYVKLTSSDTASTFASGIINDNSSTVGAGTTRAQVVATINGIGSDPPTLIVKYLSGTAFSAGSTIYLEGTTTTATVNATLPTGSSSVVSINRGVYFTNGFFVLVLPQTLVLNKYDNTPTYRIGLTTTESIVDSSTDTTLLDPASGTTNANAPGATRFKVELILAKKETSSTDPVAANADSNFIEVMRVENGVPTKHVKYPIYGEIEKTLARRTYDESGDYTIRPFPIQIIDHQGATGTTLASSDTTITGVLTDFENDFAVGDNIRLSSGTATANITSIVNSTSMVVNTALGDGSSQTIINNDRVSAAMEPGKAYVKGYEYESIGVEYVDVKKGRGTTTTTGLPVNPNMGNSLKVTGVDFGATTNGNVFNPLNLSQSYDLHSVSKTDIDNTNQNKYNSTKMGTTKIRQFDYSSGSYINASAQTSAIFDAYLFDIQLASLTMTVGSSYTSGATTITLESAKRSGDDDAYNGAKITLGSETREITDYSGTSGAATLNLAFSTSADTSNNVTINFSTREIESLAIANSTGYGTANTVLMNVDTSSKADVNDSTSNTVIADTQLNSLVFPIGIDNVKSLNNQALTFQSKKVISATFSGSGPTATITAPSNFTFETEGKSSGTLSSPKENYVVYATNTAASLANGTATIPTDGTSGLFIQKGEIVDVGIGVNSTTSLTLTPTRDQNTYTAGSFTASVIATVDTTVQAEKTKTLVSATVPASGTDVEDSGTVLTNSNDRIANGQFIVAPFTGTQSLQISDVFQINSIIEGVASSGTAGTQFTTALMSAAVGNTAHVNNITSRYIFNSGQKDNFLDHGSITLKAGQTKPANNVMILFDYFEHSTTDGYASVESYTNITYEQIPAFVSPTTGIKKELRDCIDFRPIKSISASGTIGNNDLIPDADVSMTANVVSYLGRKDKLALTKDRVFTVIEGVSSEDPILPADDEDAMTLYNLDIPPYTFNASDVDTQYIDNRRFTMRDIGKIEKRVDSLEYYTALSLLEKEASDLSIKDSATGTERFKNGILVDSFNGHNIGDVSNVDFKAAVDFEMKELRPSYYSDTFKFSHDSTGSSANTTKTGDLVTLKYSSSNLVVQPLASNTENLNPYGTNQLNGQLTLSPPSDVWFSETGRPLVLINLEGLNDHWVEGNENGFGKQWDDWSFTWSGSQINDDNLIKTRKTSATSNTISRFANITQKNKTRTGIVSTKPPETIKRTVGNRIVSVSIVPFIRSQKVQFVAKGIKPNTTFHPFFDNQTVSGNTKPAFALTYTANTTSANSGVFNTNAGEQVTLTQTMNNGSGQNVNATAMALYQNSSTILVSDLTQQVTLSGAFSANPTVGEGITFFSDSGKTTQTATATVQAFDASNNILTINSISGTIATGNFSDGDNTGDFGSRTVSHTGAFRAGEVSQGTGSAKANGNITSVSSSGPTFSASLTSDKNGVLAGEFVIPADTYRVGERLFRLTDSSTDTVASTESVAEKIFRVQGLLESRSGRVSSTRPLEPKRENVKEKNVTQDTINRISTSTNWINPLSQTFIVDRNLHENGVYVSSVDVFFSSVDTILPVTLQLRPVINEAPSSSQIIPFSETTLNASEVNVSATAPNVATSSTFTRFTFESPVYLFPDEYAIVLTSPSENYSVHVANLGETVRNTTDTNVSQQPFVASFYEPQNSSIWQANVEKQMMFRVNRCNFDTGTHAVYLSLDANPLSGNTSGVNYDVFKLSTSELTFSNTAIAYSFKGIDSSKTVNSDSTRTSQIDSAFSSFSANRNITLGTQKKVVSPISTTGQVTYAANNYYLRALLTSNDSKISPAIDMSRINLIVVENEINRGSFTNSDVVITSSGTGYTNGAFSITGTGGTSGEVTIVTDGSGVLSSAHISSAGSGYYGDASVTLTGGSSGAISIQNELGSNGGNAKTRYISRRVTLEDGFDAQDLKVFINAYKPKDTDIKVYYRVHNAEDPEDFEDKPYVLFTQQTDSNLISASESDIKEYVFRTSANNISYTSSGQTYDNFKTFSIKIVLGSASTAIIPKVKDMKAIALDF